ncbi:MAG: response regulator transcription factor [Magnetococcales bacterium]|nr:response regulator transcription factor [Magnetococcales bacterium]
MRVLVVEDEQEMANQIGVSFRQAGYATDVAFDGEEGHFLGDTEPYDAVVLDLGLPKMSGLKILEQWRSNGQIMPVLILSARDTWREKVTGLRAGADDYLAKPFEMEELIARIEVLVRRQAGHAKAILLCGHLKLDTTTKKLFLNDQLINLTALEYRLADYLMHHPDSVISKTELTEHIYEMDSDRDSNVVEVLVKRLRNKIGADLIITHRGRGYQLFADND